MKISSWNVNSVRARMSNIEAYLNSSCPDIVLLQEIKTEERNYPFEDLKKLGYLSYVNGQKSYNGVAILSKKKLDEINTELPGDKIKQSRLISTRIKLKNKNVTLINIYVPNGNPVDTEKYFYKINWLDLFVKYVKKKLGDGNSIIVSGDFNIIPEEIDVYDYKKYENDALFKLEIRKKFRVLINLGLQDVYRYFNKVKREYTFWDYMASAWQKNHGMRIDHFLVSNDLLSNIENINIDKKPRSKLKPSDHAPIELETN